MELSLDKLPKEYLIELFLSTGYPKFLDYCKTHPNLNKVCEDQHLWTLLLQQDYYDVVNDYIFTDPKQTYITIHKAFHDKNLEDHEIIPELGILASIDNNLELVNVLYSTYPKEMMYEHQRIDMLKESVEHGSFTVATYILQDKNLKINEHEGFNIIANYYRNTDKTGAEDFFNTILKDGRFRENTLLAQAIKHNDINAVKILVDQSNSDNAFDSAISFINTEVIMYLLYNYVIAKETIEKGIIELNKYGLHTHKSGILKLLLKTDKYDPNRLFVSLSKHQILDTIKYLLEHKDITIKSLNIAAINAVGNCDLKLLDLLVKQKLWDPLFANSMIFSKASNNCVSDVIKKFVNNKNYDKILIDVAKHSNSISNSNSNVLDLLLKSKFLEINNKDLLQKILTILIYRNNEDNIIIVLNHIEQLDDDILDKSAIIACENNLLKVIDKLHDYNINNVDDLFNIALDNGNIMAAIMVSNYDICNYINDERVVKFLQSYIDDKNINPENYDNNCDILYEYIDFQFFDLVKKILMPLLRGDDDELEQEQEDIYNFVNKYDTYLTNEKVNNMIDDIWQEISADMGDDMYDPYY